VDPTAHRKIFRDEIPRHIGASGAYGHHDQRGDERKKAYRKDVHAAACERRANRLRS
jgi:hypothetical protein